MPYIDLSKTQLYLEWIKQKLYLDSISNNSRKRVIKRGEVYMCHLGINIGSEECKERPCVIIQSNNGNETSSNTIIAPITHTPSNLPIVVSISDQYDQSGKLILDGYVLLGNIVCVSKARLGDYITILPVDEMKEIDRSISISLGIKKHYDKLNNVYKDKLDYIKKLKGTISDLQEQIKQQKIQIKELKEKKQ